MKVSGERNADYDLEILVDGKVMKKQRINKKNLYVVNGDLTLEGNQLDGGKHTITIRRTGEGAVYFNSYLSFFIPKSPPGHRDHGALNIHGTEKKKKRGA